jgi:hypothetical protein
MINLDRGFRDRFVFYSHDYFLMSRRLNFNSQDTLMNEPNEKMVGPNKDCSVEIKDESKEDNDRQTSDTDNRTLVWVKWTLFVTFVGVLATVFAPRIWKCYDDKQAPDIYIQELRVYTVFPTDVLNTKVKKRAFIAIAIDAANPSDRGYVVSRLVYTGKIGFTSKFETNVPKGGAFVHRVLAFDTLQVVSNYYLPPKSKLFMQFEMPGGIDYAGIGVPLRFSMTDNFHFVIKDKMHKIYPQRITEDVISYNEWNRVKDNISSVFKLKK